MVTRLGVAPERRDVPLYPPQRLDLIEEAVVARGAVLRLGGERGVGPEPQRPQPVVDRHEDDSPLVQDGPCRYADLRAPPRAVRATVDPDHHGLEVTGAELVFVVQTLRKRQSSLASSRCGHDVLGLAEGGFAIPPWNRARRSIWGHAGAKWVADCTAGRAEWASGGRQRSSSTGGLAYGMPRNTASRSSSHSPSRVSPPDVDAGRALLGERASEVPNHGEHQRPTGSNSIL